MTPGSAGLSRLAATFKAGKLDPGDYILQVKVKNLDTELERISTIPCASSRDPDPLSG